MSIFTGTETICAWCLAEQGEEPQEGDSHGICPRHADEMRAAQVERAQQKFDEIKSYTERLIGTKHY